MTGQGNGKPVHFRIVVSEAVSQEAVKQYEKAVLAGFGHLFRETLAIVERRLRREAREFGEEFFNYHALKLQARKGLIPPLLIEYAIHIEDPILYIRKIMFIEPQSGKI